MQTNGNTLTCKHYYVLLVRHLLTAAVIAHLYTP
jgi:hypothetical protein